MGSPFREIAGLKPHAIWTGVRDRVVTGERMTFAVVDLDPNAQVAEHAHPNEQVGLVLRGALAFTIGGERRDLEPGDAYLIPGGVPHEALAGPEGCSVVDVFSPPRADWEGLDRLEASPPHWP